MCNHKRWICILLCVICLSGWAFAQEGKIDAHSSSSAFQSREEVMERGKRVLEQMRIAPDTPLTEIAYMLEQSRKEREQQAEAEAAAKAEAEAQAKAEAEAEAEAKRIAEENFAKEYEANLEAERTRVERNTIIQNCVLLGVGTAVCVVAVVAVIKNNREKKETGAK